MSTRDKRPESTDTPASSPKAMQAREVAAAVTLTIATDGLPPAEPPPLDRLLASLPDGRHARFASKVAQLLDVEEDAALGMLRAIDEPASWEEGFLPGMELFHVQGGPAVSAAITGFVRLPAGSHFPDHRHLGEEQVLILQGFCRDGDQTVGPGTVLPRPAGSAHSFDVLEGSADLLYLAIVNEGLEVGDLVLRADDPRA